MKKHKAIAIIPARMGSTRFPGKPLADIAGQSMIMRVYGACLGADLDEVWVATDSAEILEHVLAHGGRAVMTSPKHRNGTERVAEVAAKMDADIVVNVQGDEPFAQASQINALVRVLAEEGAGIATLAIPTKDTSLLNNPNAVKVTMDKQGRALYFSRAAIPYPRVGEWEGFKHLGMYGFRRETLLEVVKLPETPLERMESLEQLRWLEHGYGIQVCLTDVESPSVDVPADLEKVADFMRKYGLV